MSVEGRQSQGPVPPWTVLVLDDNLEFLADTCQAIEQAVSTPDGSPLRVVAVSEFDEALARLYAETIDVAVLDVRNETGGHIDEDAGVEVFDRIREVRFLPVVFFTGIPDRVAEFEDSPSVHVVARERGSGAAAGAVQAAFDSRLPVAARALGDHVRDVTRDYLGDVIIPRWDEVGAARPDHIAGLLVGRLAKSLEVASTSFLQGRLDGSGAEEGYWHPSQVYVYPPLGAEFETGDVLHHRDDQWFVLLTPACDLAQHKADFVLLASCNRVTDTPEFAELVSSKEVLDRYADRVVPKGGWPQAEREEQAQAKKQSGKQRGFFSDVIRGRLARYVFLPTFMDLPNLIIDLQNVASRPVDELSDCRRVCSLNAPYAQSLVARYTSYVGRIGLPDPDVERIMRELL